MIWRTCKGHAQTLRLRTVYLYLPQPVAACLRAPPPGGGLPALAKVHVPETSPCTYLAAYWKADMSYTPTTDFHRWYMTRVTCGPLVLATCQVATVRCVSTSQSTCRFLRFGLLCSFGSLY